MKRLYKYAWVALALIMWQCEPNTDEFSPKAGSADFSKFITIGDSYTAGYTDGALGQRGQMESFSYILAKQLKYVGSATFNQPLVKSNGSVGTTVLAPNQNNGYFELQVVGGAVTPVPTIGDMAIFTEQVYDADNQNFGVPGAKAAHLLAPGFGNPAAGAGRFNPYYTRFMSAPGASVIADAMAANPTFVSLWIGGNDVLGYALEGGESDAITPVESFAGYLNAIVGQIFTNKVKGVIANVPGVDALPYFNTITYDALVFKDTEEHKAKIAQLNAGYNQKYNVAAEKLGLPKIEFKVGKNAIVINDPKHPLKVRQMTANDKKKILLSASAVFAKGMGSATALPDNYILNETEISAVKAATTEYNKTIKTIAEAKGLAHVDLFSIMDKLSKEGLWVDGVKYTTTFVSGGMFSLDGIHATGRGSAVIANAFIDAINEEYGASVPRSEVNDYSFVEFPEVTQ